jgi:hypothetical protein
MAVGGFKRYVADRQIHYFIRARMMTGRFGGHTPSGSQEAAEIARWVETHYAPITVDNVTIYDLTQRASNT